HRSLFTGNEELYGENVRSKVERCLQVRDEEVAAAELERADYCERVAEAVGELDLLVTPTAPFVAPPAEVDELEIRAGAISLTYPISSLGWPALALPCGPAEYGLPPSGPRCPPAGAATPRLAAPRLL